MKHQLIGTLKAKEGQQEALGAILLRAASLMANAKGCQFYAVAKKGEEMIWITEIWDSKEDHENSLSLPGVRELISEAMPLLAEPPRAGTDLQVLGGHGL